jgi:glucose-6-phosphate-specific signal transduction histidine kinase
MKRIVHFFMLSCRKATELIEKKSVTRLSVKEKIGLGLHKSICDACTAYEKQSRKLDQLMRDQSQKNAAGGHTTDLKEKIIKSLPGQ